MMGQCGHSRCPLSSLAIDNKDFCAMPLTHDYHANPFRVRLDRIEESPSLLHAAMALSSQHLAKLSKSASMATEMHAHQSTAMQLFRAALSHPNSEPVLDTLLLLIILEVSISSIVRTNSNQLHKDISVGSRYVDCPSEWRSKPTRANRR